VKLSHPLDKPQPKSLDLNRKSHKTPLERYYVRH
jgi:hypothetical protein